VPRVKVDGRGLQQARGSAVYKDFEKRCVTVRRETERDNG
jgi:hypothetical protein